MAKVKDLNTQSREYSAKITGWDSLNLLSCGGYEIMANASRFLFQRPREGVDVYTERLKQATYQNILGAVAGWYQSALGKNNPSLMVLRDGKALEDKAWWGEFEQDVNRGGEPLADFGSDILRDFIVYGEAWVQVDLPRTDGRFVSLAQQQSAGALNAFLRRWDPRSVIDWREDDAGRLEWVKVTAAQERREFLGQAKSFQLWYYFDRESFRAFEAERKDGKLPEDAVELDGGRHAMSGFGQVPIMRFRVPGELWLGNRALPQLLEHFRTENGLGWSIENACYPIPYLKGEFSDTPTPSVTTFLHLAADGEFGYAETSGSSFDAAAKRCASLREDIYRACYLQAQGRSTEATPAAQSGYSKEMDMAPALDVLGRFGRAIRSALGSILANVAKIRLEEVTFALSGYEFDHTGTENALDNYERVIDAGIDSDTLARTMAKRAARSLLTGEDPAVIEKAEREIETGPSREEKAAAEMAARKASVAAAFGR